MLLPSHQYLMTLTNKCKHNCNMFSNTYVCVRACICCSAPGRNRQQLVSAVEKKTLHDLCAMKAAIRNGKNASNNIFNIFSVVYVILRPLPSLLLLRAAFCACSISLPLSPAVRSMSVLFGLEVFLCFHTFYHFNGFSLSVYLFIIIAFGSF